MELTIEQALQQGVAAHREGNLQEAERLYRTILQAQPTHPGANYNLGVLAVAVNKADAALPLFKIALEANPKKEQFWLSYIDALIKEKQFENAKQAFEQCKTQGVAVETLNTLESLLAPGTQTENGNSVSPSQQQLSSLLEHYENGRYEDAEKLAISMTQEFPEHHFAWKVLGVLLGQKSRTAEALNANQKAVQLAPQDAAAHINLGITLRELARLDEAEASCRQAIALKSDNAEAHYNLGNTLKDVGRLEEAEASHRQAIALNPDFAEAHNNLANTLQELGRLDEAEASYRQAIELKPDYAEAHYNLGSTLRELGRFDEAEASCRQAIELKSDFAEAHSNLGNALKELARLDEAEASYRQAIELKPDYAEAHYNLGNTLRELGKLEEAEASYRQAIELKPDYAGAFNNLGAILEELDRLEEAEVNYSQAIALKSDFSAAYLNLCELLEKTNNLDDMLLVIKNAKGKVSSKEADFLFYEALVPFRQENYKVVERLITKINKEELTGNRKQSFLKLKADWHDNQKDFSVAFEAFKIMNDTVKDTPEYKNQGAEKYFKEKREIVFQIESLQQESSYKAAVKASWLQPTFLIGFPRSGTTLLDTILRSHSKIDVVEEKQMLSEMRRRVGYLPKVSAIEEIDNTAAEIASGFYFEELKKHLEPGKNSIVIDKLPLNILELPLINQIFPQAKFILALRHPLDCVLSCWMQSFKLNPAMANMVDLDRVVDFYCTAMEILKLCQKRYALNIHRIRYEDLVLDFEGEVSNTLAFLNLTWEEGLRNYQKTAFARGRINTPSYSQVVKPIYNTAIYRWKNYEKYLGSCKGRIEPWLNEYGYSC